MLDDRCDLSHRQGVIHRVYSFPMKACDFGRMAALDMKSVRDELQKAMDVRGIKAKPLSIAAELGETAVRDILEGRSNDPKLGTLHKLAEVLDYPVEQFLGHEAVQLLGRIGAGGHIAWRKEDEVAETVPRPPLAPGPVIALEVIGSSMLPKYEQGDIIYIRRDHDGVLPQYLGRYCAVCAGDGGTYLKMLTAGSIPDRYTLRSLNAPDMENVEVIWAAPVLFVMPRR